MAWLARIAGVLAVVHAGSSLAAPLAVPSSMETTTPIAVRVVRSSDPRCAPDHCSDWIALDGSIGPGSAAKFARIVQTLGGKRLPVLISSPGGLVSEAMTMGRLIRDKRLDIAVTRTILASCPADRDACRTSTPDGLVLGVPSSHRAVCASACTLVLAAGARRFVGPWAGVGVHQYVAFAKTMKVMRMFRVVTRTVNGMRREVSRTLVSERPLPKSAVLVRRQPTYEESAAYFARMGIGSGIMPLIQSAPSTGVHWLTPDELLATRMATDDVGGENLINPGRAAPAVPVAAVMPNPPSPVPTDRSGVAADHEIAALIDDAGLRIRLTPGRVTWSVARNADQAGNSRSADLVANVALDDDAGSLTFRIAKQENASGHVAEHLFVRLLHGGNSPFGQILAIETPGLRKDAHALPDAFVGQIEDAPPAGFSMQLSDTAEDAARDMALLSSDQWIDVPIMVDAARTVRLTFALGVSGARAVQEWEDAPVVRAAR